MSDRFAFGANWQGYLKRHFSEERAEIARKWLLDFLKLDRLDGLTFLDIGCGSGLHSLGAWRSGAKRVISFDYDPQSVAATRSLHEAAGSPDNWEIFQGSILDEDLCARLGQADIVYSWGVLHHTGDQWRAIANAMSMMGPHSRLYIALYTSDQYVEPPPEYWLRIKRRYNGAGFLTKRIMEAQHVWRFICLRRVSNLLRLPAIARAYKADRGMAMMPDVRDWLGGWPMEFSAVREVIEFAEARGLALVNLKTGAGNTEYLFARAEATEALGLAVVPRENYSVFLCQPMKEAADLAPIGDFFVFGTARGAKLLAKAVKDAGTPRILGFIDLEQSGEMDGLPVHSFDDFVARFPKDVPVVLSNQYVVENSARLIRHGFTNIHNGHPVVLVLAARMGMA